MLAVCYLTRKSREAGKNESYVFVVLMFGFLKIISNHQNVCMKRFSVLLTAFLKSSARNKFLFWGKSGDFCAAKLGGTWLLPCQNFMLWSTLIAFSPSVTMIADPTDGEIRVVLVSPAQFLMHEKALNIFFPLKFQPYEIKFTLLVTWELMWGFDLFS